MRESYGRRSLVGRKREKAMTSYEFAGCSYRTQWECAAAIAAYWIEKEEQLSSDTTVESVYEELLSAWRLPEGIDEEVMRNALRERMVELGWESQGRV